MANKYVFKCRLNVDSDGDDVTNDGRLFHARAAATGKARSPIVLRRVTGTTTAAGELERRLRLVVVTSAARLMLSARYAGAVPLRHRKTKDASVDDLLYHNTLYNELKTTLKPVENLSPQVVRYTVHTRPQRINDGFFLCFSFFSSFQLSFFLPF